MMKIGREFAERLFEIAALMARYPRARSKRKELELEIQRRIDEFETFAFGAESEAFVEYFLEILKSHSNPDGTSLDVTEFLSQSAEEFMSLEKSGTPFGTIKRADFARLVTKLASFNKNKTIQIDRLTSVQLIKFLCEGLTETFHNAKSAKSLPRRKKKAQRISAGYRAWLMGTGASMALTNAMLSLHPAFPSQVAITSMWLGMSGVGDGAFQVRTNVSSVIRDLVAARQS